VATERKFIWIELRPLRGWACDGCGWRIPNPAERDRSYTPEIRKMFNAHDCSLHPRRPVASVIEFPPSPEKQTDS
jgi:hypothetical protein